MLIFIISAVLLVIGLVLFKIGDDFYSYHEGDTLIGWGTGIMLVAGCALLVCLIAIAIVQIPKEREYVEMDYQRQVLELRLDKVDEDITGNELVYHDIVEFNNKLHLQKKYANSPWLNWFYNDKIATIDYIEIDGITYGVS